MKVGIRPLNDLDFQTLNFYERNYSVVDTPDFQDDTRLLKPDKNAYSPHSRRRGYSGMKMVGNDGAGRRCRFCGRSYPEVTFEKVAHAIPESTGNKALETAYECDECNSFFGDHLEYHFGRFFQFYRALEEIHGKKGVPRVASDTGFTNKDGVFLPDFELSWQNDPFTGGKALVLMVSPEGKKMVHFTKENMGIKYFVPNTCCPIAVYKTFVKMAITLLPFTEINLFSDATKWLLQPEHENIFSPRKLLLRYRLIPGFNVVEYPHFTLYKRKEISDLPYMIFNITYGGFDFMIEVPRDNDKNYYDIRNMPMPPIPYYSGEPQVWDLSEKHFPEGFYLSIQLSFGQAIEETDDVEIAIVNGKRVLKKKK